MILIENLIGFTADGAAPIMRAQYSQPSLCTYMPFKLLICIRGSPLPPKNKQTKNNGRYENATLKGKLMDFCDLWLLTTLLLFLMIIPFCYRISYYPNAMPLMNHFKRQQSLYCRKSLVIYIGTEKATGKLRRQGSTKLPDAISGFIRTLHQFPISDAGNYQQSTFQTLLNILPLDMIRKISYGRRQPFKILQKL